MATAATAERRIPFCMRQTYDWMRMFNALCSRYPCRSVSRLADAMLLPPIDSGLYFVSGPDGRWLAEVTSVRIARIEQRAQLAPVSHDAIMRLVLCAHRDRFAEYSSSSASTTTTTTAAATAAAAAAAVDTTNYIIAFDWCIQDTSCAFEQRGVRSSLSSVTTWLGDDDGAEEERRCLLRVDFNNRMVVLYLLDSVVVDGDVTVADSAISIAQNTYIVDCCRPFLFILACELHVRDIAYLNVDMHHALRVAVDAADPVEHASFMHARATGIHVPCFAPGNNQSDYLYNTVLQSTLGNGCIRLTWRDGTLMKSSRQLGVINSCSVMPPGANFQLSHLQREIRRDEHHLLSLCDFDVFHKRCKESSMLTIFAAVNDCGDDELWENDASLVACDSGIDVRTLPYDERVYEQRYCVDSTNTLVSRPFLQLS